MLLKLKLMWLIVSKLTDMVKLLILLNLLLNYSLNGGR